MSRGQEYVRGILPELSRIKDPKLRGGVVETWRKAMEVGGWEDVEDIPFTLLIPEVPVRFVDHVRAVTQMCISVAKVLEVIHESSINMDHLVAGALLHDVGKLVEYKRRGFTIEKSEVGGLLRHPFTGVWLALECGIPGEVAHLIATHSHEGDRVERTPEAIVLHHCDFIHFELMKRRYSR